MNAYRSATEVYSRICIIGTAAHVVFSDAMSSRLVPDLDPEFIRSTTALNLPVDRCQHQRVTARTVNCLVAHDLRRPTHHEQLR